MDLLRELRASPGLSGAVVLMLSTEADLLPNEQEGTLTVSLHHLANAASDQVVQELSQHLNASETVFPGTNLRIIYKLVSC